MKRFRIPLGLLCILTLPIFTIASVLAIFSFFAADQWSYVPPDRLVLHDFCLTRGQFWYFRSLGRYRGDEGQRGWEHTTDAAVRTSWIDRPELFTTSFTLLGFAYCDQSETEFRLLALPLWPVIALTAIPTILWIRRRRSPKWQPGHCRECGYDLRATADRCPECGTPAPNSSATL